jgi:hypothetical protein
VAVIDSDLSPHLENLIVPETKTNKQNENKQTDGNQQQQWQKREAGCS